MQSKASRRGGVVRLGYGVAVLLSVGCHDGGGDGYDGGPYLVPTGGGGGSMATQRQLTDLIHASCEYYRRCCQESGLSLEPLADCEMRELETSDADAIARNTIRFVEPAFSQCLNAIRSTGCTELETHLECLAAFQGSVASGGTCFQTAECTRGNQPVTCVRAQDAADDEPGTCRTLRSAGAGEPCLFTIQAGPNTTLLVQEADLSSPLAYCDPAAGLTCDPVESVCTQVRTLGEPCANDCERELYCDGTCKTPKPDGSPCVSNDFDECGPGAWCNEGVCRKFTVVDTEVCEGDFD